MAKEKLSYVFPNAMAKMMKNVSMQTQLESSMMSMSLIMIGMFLMAIYMTFYVAVSWVYKGLIFFNLGCAFLFISSFLVTTYQQYISYMNMAGIDPAKHKAEIKRRGNIFKRIKLAIQAKKAKKKSLKQPPIVKEAVENMIKIKQDELKDTQKLQEEAERLREADRLREIDNNKIEKEVN